MKTHFILAALFAFAAFARAEIKSATYDLAAIRDASTLETRVVQDWQPAPRDPAVRQKVVEITVCEWWPGQKVRLPVTFNVPASGGPFRHVIVANQALAAKPALPGGAMLRLLKERGVGVVLVGMGTIDAMPPAGKLHLGMKEWLLKTKDARYTPAWIWGLSDMRALTAAVAEKDVFQPVKVLATGGSKRGVGAAAAGIHDDRFTAILPVVAPPLGNPGGAFVIGTDAPEVIAANERFLSDLAGGRIPALPATALKSLRDRDERRGNERLTVEQASSAGWSASEIAAMNDRAWDVCRVAAHLPALQKRGLEIFYNVGANDNVSPDLLELGQRFPAFPIFIVPGGQHGGPKDTGFTRQVPAQAEVEDNLLAFAAHHFFGARARVAAPEVRTSWDSTSRVVSVTVRFPDGTEPQKSDLSWSLNRHSPGTLAFEYDNWSSVPLRRAVAGGLVGSFQVPKDGRTVELLTTHTHTLEGLSWTVSSPLLRLETN